MGESPKPRLLPAFVPFGLIGITAAYVLYRRGVDSDDAVTGALVMTASALLIVGLLEAASRFAPANPHGLDAEAAGRVAIALRGLARLTELALAVSMSYAALALVRTHRLAARPFAGVLFAALAAAIAIGTKNLARTMRDLRREDRIPNLRGWNGPFYRNRDDRRLWVPKITGIGWTLNFGRRAAWPILVALLGLTLLALFSANLEVI